MRQVTIDRQLWGRGETGGKLSRNGKRCCCLSFVCHQLYGVPWNNMNHHLMPESLSQLNDDNCSLLIDFEGSGGSTPLANDASAANDCQETSDTKKEEQIIELFANEDIEIKFIN